jgi:hypothetical protein
MAISKIGSNSVNLASGLTIADGDLTLASGHGVSFVDTDDTSVSGASTSNELLDDYEEGTWTPTLTSGYSYDGLQAHYTKIGNIVYIYASLYRDGFSSNSNTYVITNLPFTPETSTRVNSNGLGHWSCYNGSTDRRHGILNASNDGNVYLVQDGTKVHATYDGVCGSDNYGLVIKWFYYTA